VNFAIGIKSAQREKESNDAIVCTGMTEGKKPTFLLRAKKEKDGKKGGAACVSNTSKKKTTPDGETQHEPPAKLPKKGQPCRVTTAHDKEKKKKKRRGRTPLRPPALTVRSERNQPGAERGGEEKEKRNG